jgi:hypothetical protein
MKIKLPAELPARQALGPKLLEATWHNSETLIKQNIFSLFNGSSFCPPSYSKLSSVML